MSNSEHVSTEMLADYAEGLLRESEASAVAEHLAECAECRAEELLLASLSEILAADDVGPMPAVYAARIDAALADVARTSPVGSGSAGTDPVAGSFHPEGAYATTGALDLTPSALAASSGAASAEVIDLAARRKVVAQGLSRVTTVAASIVLLIGGTVLGLQALNSGDENTLDSPNEFAQNQVQPFARETIQPSPIRNSRVPIYVGAKKNPDGSYTNPNGVVVRPDGSAVLLNGKVLKPQKKSSGDTAPEPAGDPTLVVGPQPADSRVTSKSGGSGPMVAADKDKDAQDDARPADVTVDPADPTINPATPEPDEGAGAPAGGGETAEPAPDSAKALSAESAEGPRTAGTEDTPAKQPASRPYVEESGSEYTTDNFAEKVLALLDRAGYRESSVGDPQVDSDASEPSATVSPSESPQSYEAQYQEASLNTAAAAPTAPEVADRVQAQGPASNEVKRRVLRCARQLGGEAIAGDTGVWKGEAVTIVVLPDPSDDRQVVAHAVAGPCTAERPADDAENIRHIQFIVAKP